MPDESGGGVELILTYVTIAFLVMCSGLFSGLTLGLLGLDLTGLAIVEQGDDPDLRAHAAKIRPVREYGNQLLCTLLLGNVVVNSGLSILLDSVAGGVSGFLISTALIVLFGEIIPQASCSRYALEIGAFTAPLVQQLLYLFYPAAKPLAMSLDYFLGEEVGTVYSVNELIEIMRMQIAEGVEKGQMDPRQVALGALAFSSKKLEEVMVTWDDAFMLQADMILNYETLKMIFERGLSRIPVYGKEKDDHVGLLYTRDLMLVDPDDERRLQDVIDVFQRKAVVFDHLDTCKTAINIFKQGRNHLGLIKAPPGGKQKYIGLVTLEDIVEELLMEEIEDETDERETLATQHPTQSHAKPPSQRFVFMGMLDPQLKGPESGPLTEKEVGIVVDNLKRAKVFQHAALSRGTGRDELTDDQAAWMVSRAKIDHITRMTQVGAQSVHESDYIFKSDTAYDKLVVVLHGRISVKVGRQGFFSDVGYMHVLAPEAPNDPNFISDFDAVVGTKKLSILTITKKDFDKASKQSKVITADNIMKTLATPSVDDGRARSGSAVSGSTATTGIGNKSSQLSKFGKSPISRQQTL